MRVMMMHRTKPHWEAGAKPGPELVAGYTLIQVKSKDAAMEWARRFPNPAADGGEGELEVRPLFELEDLGESAAVERFRELGVGGTKDPAR